MKIRLRPDGPGMREPSESEMNDWLVNLREDDEPEPADPPEDAEPYGDTEPSPGMGEPYAVAWPYGTDEEPAREAMTLGAQPLLGAPVAEMTHEAGDPTGTGEPAEAYGVVPGVAAGPDDPTGTGETGETAGAGRGRVEAAVSGSGEASGVAGATFANAAVAGAPVADAAVADAPVADPPAAEMEPAAGRRRRLAPGRRRPQAPIETPVRALIGEELRTPTVWCELEPGTCVSWHADREALGVADVRERAIAVGWRIDALGRLTCPQCQQRSAIFRTTQPVVLWSRAYALTMAAREAARQGGFPYPQPAFYPR
jgi:hypothetical protein